MNLFFNKYYLGAILMLFCVYLNAQNRSLNNKIEYNSNIGDKVLDYPNENELKIEKEEFTYKGNINELKKDTIIFDHLTLIKKFNKNNVQNITQTTKPRFSFSKKFNSYSENTIQMFASPTASTIGKNRLNVSSHYLLFYKVNYGVLDKLDIGVGFTINPQLQDSTAEVSNGQMFNLSLKYKIRDTRHLDWSVGVSTFRLPKGLLGSPISQKAQFMHYGYIAASADYSVLNFSASFGQPFIGTVSNKYIGTGTGINYIFTASGSLLISDNLALVIENWWLNGITNIPGQVNSSRKGVPDFPLIGGRYYSGAYGASVGIGNFFIKGVKPFSAFYVDGFYYF